MDSNLPGDGWSGGSGATPGCGGLNATNLAPCGTPTAISTKITQSSSIQACPSWAHENMQGDFGEGQHPKRNKRCAGNIQTN
jgi:hypothetical protein